MLGQANQVAQEHDVLCLKTIIQLPDSAALWALPFCFWPLSLALSPVPFLGLDFMSSSSDTSKD